MPAMTANWRVRQVEGSARISSSNPCSSAAENPLIGRAWRMAPGNTANGVDTDASRGSSVDKVRGNEAVVAGAMHGRVGEEIDDQGV